MSDQNDYEQALEEIRQEPEEGREAPVYRKLSDEQKLGWGLGVFFVLGILGAVANPTNPVGGFFSIGIIGATFVWVAITETGRAFYQNVRDNMNNSSQQQQQQQIGGNSDSGPKVMCQNCGWQNPQGNNYCHDCGSEL